MLWGFPPLHELTGSLLSPACRAGNSRAFPPPLYIIHPLAQRQRSVPRCILHVKRERGPSCAGTWDRPERGAGGLPWTREKVPASPAPLAALRSSCLGDHSSAFGAGGGKVFPFSFILSHANFSIFLLRVPLPLAIEARCPSSAPLLPAPPAAAAPSPPSRVGSKGRYSHCCCARTSAPWLGCEPHPR